MGKTLLFMGLLLALTSCNRKGLLDEILDGGSPVFERVMADPEHYELQVLYVQIDRDEEQRPSFRHYSLNVDPRRYFYPASTVKMPVALLAYDKINRLGMDGLSPGSIMVTDSVRYPQSAVEFDTTAANGRPSVAHYAKKIFLVSDNDAYNRLYEFVGQNEINTRLRGLGVANTRIIHRLSDFRFGPEENKYTNPVSFYNEENLVYSQPEAYTEGLSFVAKQGESKGVGYIDTTGTLVEEPFDFSFKNFYPLPDQVEMMKRIIFPGIFPEERQLNITPPQREQILRYMSMLPRESDFPRYSDSIYQDSYVKFFMFGDSKEKMPDNIRVFNKVGQAYGYLTDVAYIADLDNEIEFILAATLLVNENRIFNDGEYEYEGTGFPFLAELGRKIYEHELVRERRVSPELSEFQLNYDLD